MSWYLNFCIELKDFSGGCHYHWPTQRLDDYDFFNFTLCLFVIYNILLLPKFITITDNNRNKRLNQFLVPDSPV